MITLTFPNDCPIDVSTGFLDRAYRWSPDTTDVHVGIVKDIGFGQTDWIAAIKTDSKIAIVIGAHHLPDDTWYFHS